MVLGGGDFAATACSPSYQNCAHTYAAAKTTKTINMSS